MYYYTTDGILRRGIWMVTVFYGIRFEAEGCTARKPKRNPAYRTDRIRLSRGHGFTDSQALRKPGTQNPIYLWLRLSFVFPFVFGLLGFAYDVGGKAVFVFATKSRGFLAFICC